MRKNRLLAMSLAVLLAAALIETGNAGPPKSGGPPPSPSGVATILGSTVRVIGEIAYWNAGSHSFSLLVQSGGSHQLLNFVYDPQKFTILGHPTNPANGDHAEVTFVASTTSPLKALSLAVMTVKTPRPPPSR